MATMRISFWGESLRKQTNMTVLLPDEAEAGGPYPVLYQLHGLSDDDSEWTRQTSIERYVEKMPLIVVMPDSGRGWYTDAVRGPAYESHIMKDVTGLIDKFFRTIPQRRGRAIGGLSMGGYGAMKLALKYPDHFCSVAAHSSAFDIRKRLTDREDLKDEVALIFGDDPAEGDNDVFRLAEQIDKAALPAIRFDCGAGDHLIEENRAFHTHLEGLGIPHEYEELPGEHNWAYWDAHIGQALSFQAAALGISVQ